MLSRQIQNSIPKYSFLDLIHAGVSSTIYLVLDESGKEYALKLYNETKDDEHFTNELKMFSLLCNEGNSDFIRYISSSKDDKNSTVNYIVFEFAEKGSLNKYISPKKPFDEKIVKFMAWNIANIVDKLHKLCFSHRDLNIYNILLDQNYKLKLGGFGSAKYFLNQSGKSGLLNDKILPSHFTAPEVGKQPYDGNKVDIFNLGMLFLYLRTGKDIFTYHKNNIYKYIKDKKYAQFWSVVELGDNELKLTPEFKDLIISMLGPNYKKRPDISYVLDHPWFDEIRFLTYDGLQTYENAFRKKLKEIEVDFPQKNFI